VPCLFQESNSGASMMRKIPGLIVVAILLVLSQSSPVAAQEPEKSEKSEKDAKPGEAKPAPEPPAPKEESSVTDHTIKIGGQTIAYRATASTTLIKDEKGEPTAGIFTIAYTRSDVKDMSQRPLSFVYNGGPGSSSIWLHMGAFGPRRVVTTDAGPTPPPPFKLVDNAECLLDKTDLVFVDPVGTGFSRAVGKAKDKDFWGVDQDVKSQPSSSPPTSAATAVGTPPNFSSAKATEPSAPLRSAIIFSSTTECISTASTSSLPFSISVRFRSCPATTYPTSSTFPATPPPPPTINC
jgi:hypothetical protein